MKNETIAFMPGVRGSGAMARYWLQQVTLRLRREVCWLWRERQAQGLPIGADLRPPGASDLPPFVAPALGALDLARYAQDKQVFFAEDITARHLSELLAEPPPDKPEPQRGSFGWVVESLALEPVETFVLGLALLPAVDSAAGAVIASCLNDPGRGEPTLALAQRLWDEPDELLRCFDPAHALLSHGLLAQAAPSWSAPLQMPALVARELMFPAPQSVASWAGRRRLIPVLGAQGAALDAAAAQAAARSGLSLMRASAAPGAEHLRALMTVAWLRGAALYMPLAALAAADVHGHEPGAGSAPLPLPDLPVSLYIGVHERSAIGRLGGEALPAIEVLPASHADRLAAWQAVLPTTADGALLAEAARRFRCETTAIGRIGEELSQLGRAPTADELFAAARADLDLGALAQAVAPRFGLAELMLPPAQTRQVAEVVTAMNNLGRVHQLWGTAKAWNEGGLAALFAGPPGTGKTMASEAIALELKLPMVRIDLSQVVNKYIGETEKNLKRLFDAADAADTILFFDEADALFGKRTEVKDAHDRYANLEISYLLERMERFKGLAILATNRRRDLDEAFLRRLRFVIEFPLPGVPERERIWRGVIPEGVAANELDFEFLAQRFPLAGGHIRAIVFHACLQSAGEGAPRQLTMQAVIRAVQREYAKLERASSLDQYGPYAPLVAAEKAAR
ncbi:MAG: ATP-binding protein [Burkholderiales bacterium]